MLCVWPGYAARIQAERAARWRSVATRQTAAPRDRAFQHNTAGVKRNFQQHTTQRM